MNKRHYTHLGAAVELKVMLERALKRKEICIKIRLSFVISTGQVISLYNRNQLQVYHL